MTTLEKGTAPAAASPEQIISLLEQAAAFPHDTWIQRVEARDAAGRECYPFQQKAVKFCALGRLNRVCQRAQAVDPIRAALSRAISAVLPAAAGNNLARWNDHPDRTPQEVQELFQQAAARLRAAQA